MPSTKATKMTKMTTTTTTTVTATSVSRKRGASEAELDASADAKPSTSAAAAATAGAIPASIWQTVHAERVRVHTSAGKLVAANTATLRRPCKSVVYWIQREARVQDNWSLLFAQQLALAFGVPLHVVFCVVPAFHEATERQYHFMLDGLKEVEQSLAALHIPFYCSAGLARDVLPPFVAEHQAAAVVTDFSPLKIFTMWANELSQKLDADSVPLFRVDSHNIVPVWRASDRVEVGARTLRPKIHRLLSEFLVDFPAIQAQASTIAMPTPTDWKAIDASLTIDRTVKPVTWIKPGESNALATLRAFLQQRLRSYADLRNDPTHTVSSDLSPYLHFGQISAQRCVLQAKALQKQHPKSCESFIEELVVRRELSDNFCFYQPHYDSIDGAAAWARDSLRLHQKDKREHLYTLSEFECGVTHDDLWNAAQLQLVKEGKMHGFLRMYWAKKMLEWTESAEQAHRWCLYLNDKYELDGRDPNGYVGVAWSIFGVHDMGWTERPIFGKIRFMNYNGCKRKFDVARFVCKYPQAMVGTAGFLANKKRAAELEVARNETKRA